MNDPTPRNETRSPNSDPDLPTYIPETGIDRLTTGSGKSDVVDRPDPFQTLDSTVPNSHAPSLSNTIRYFGDYELLEEIARGGMGVVYKARQVTLNRIVALKMILSGQLASSEQIRRFHTEAEAAATLDHPGIVPIFEIGEHEGQYFFSMAYMDGMSLSTRVRHGSMPPAEAALLTRKIAEAVDYAHAKGVIHRDLKPANVLLDAHGEPRVSDFGLARRLDDDSGLTQSGVAMGTPSYMPPEQAAGRTEDIGPLSDVYSLGAMLYCLLTGRPPFQSSNSTETLRLVQEQEPVPPRILDPMIDTDLETICLKCLEKLPSQRYASAKALAEDLDRFLNDQPILARPPGWLEKCSRWARQHVVIVAVLMVLLICTASVFPAVISAALHLQSMTRLIPRIPSSTDIVRSPFGTIEVMDKTIQQQPDNGAARFARGLAYYSLLKYPEALEDAEKAAKLTEHRDWHVLLLLGSTLSELERHQESCDVLARAVAVSREPAILLKLAKEKQAVKAFSEGLSAVSEVIKLQPGLAEAYSVRAGLLDELGRPAEAAEDRLMAQRLGLDEE
ncbi:MAG: serine/threonine-protein kinase [Planctomycetaceae bacterium]